MAARASGLSSIPHRAARVLAEGGPQHLLLQALRKLTQPLLECGSVIFFARDLSEPPPEPRAALDLKLHIASPAKLDLLLNSPEFQQTAEGPELPVLVKRTEIEKSRQDKLSRARAWHAWFESWLDEPHAKRSSGFSSLPEEYFVSAADYIVSALALDPKSDFVLDVGCDSAMISRLVAPRCRRLVGVGFIPGLLADIPDEAARSAASGRACFVAADGRFLSFKSHIFTKAYCSAVIHTLPSVEDGARMIEELVRVCRPGGTVLVASIPDRAKRFSAYLEAWRRSGLAGRRSNLPIRIPRQRHTGQPADAGSRSLVGAS